MSTVREVAKLAGVSVSTVSAVINSNKYVSSKVKAKVMFAMEQLEYDIHAHKAGGAERNKKIIGVILPTITSIFFPKVLKGIEEAAANHCALMFCDTSMSFLKEKKYMEMLKRNNVVGIILDSMCVSYDQPEYLAWIRQEFIDRRGITVVLLEHVVNEPGFYSIGIDNYLASYNITKHLIQMGHKKIAHIGCEADIFSWQERSRGYVEALKDAGIKYNPRLTYTGNLSPLSGYTAATSLIETTPDFTALFSANDQMAIGAIKAFKQAAWNIPDDIALAGFDNISVSTMIDPALTTVNVPTYQMGYLAAKTIIDIENEEKQDTSPVTVLETKPIIRKSSDKTAFNEWELIGW